MGRAAASARVAACVDDWLTGCASPRFQRAPSSAGRSTCSGAATSPSSRWPSSSPTWRAARLRLRSPRAPAAFAQRGVPHTRAALMSLAPTGASGVLPRLQPVPVVAERAAPAVHGDPPHPLRCATLHAVAAAPLPDSPPPMRVRFARRSGARCVVIARVVVGVFLQGPSTIRSTSRGGARASRGARRRIAATARRPPPRGLRRSRGRARGPWPPAPTKRRCACISSA